MIKVFDEVATWKDDEQLEDLRALLPEKLAWITTRPFRKTSLFIGFPERMERAGEEKRAFTRQPEPVTLVPGKRVTFVTRGPGTLACDLTKSLGQDRCV